MNLFDIPVLNVLRTRMDYLSARQDVLAENIANANTPGYAAKDLAAPSFQELLNGPAGRERFARAGAPGEGFDVIERPDAIATRDGNTVSLDMQMMKVAETQLAYTTATGLYQKAVGLLRLAIGRPQG